MKEYIKYYKAKYNFFEAYKSNNFVKAIELGEEMMEFNDNTESILYADDLFNLAFVYSEVNNYENAIKLLKESVKLTEKYHGESDDYYNKLSNLAIYYSLNKEYDIAVELHNKVYEFRFMNYPADDEIVSNATYNLANSYIDIKNYKEAKIMLEEINLYTDNTYKYADVLNCIGYCHEGMENSKEAIKCFVKSLKEIEKTETKESINYIQNLYYLFTFYCKIKDRKNAITVGNKCLNIMKKINAENHPNYFKLSAEVGNLFIISGKYKEAHRIFKKNQKLIKILVSENCIQYANTTKMMSICNFHLDKLEIALKEIEECLLIKKNLLGSNNFDYIKDNIFRLSIYIRKEMFTEALTMFAEVMETSTKYDEEFSLAVTEIMFKTLENYFMLDLESLKKLVGEGSEKNNIENIDILQKINQISKGNIE